MIDWTINDDDMRAAVLSRLVSDRDDMIRQAERAERDAADRNRSYRERREDAACASYSRRQAAHYQQAIDLLTAAPMPIAPLSERVGEAVALLRARGVDAFTVTGTAIGVRSRLAPTYCVATTERETWTAEQIADDIAEIEGRDSLTAAPMPEPT